MTTVSEISVDDPRDPNVRALLERHLAFCLSETPPEHSFALDVDALVQPAIAFFSYRDGGAVLGVGAIKELDAGHAEIKSMHTAAEARGRGVARAMLNHLLTVARSRGYQRVSLETGTTPGFAAARAMYESSGFTPGEPFADYVRTEDNTFYTLILSLHPRRLLLLSRENVSAETLTGPGPGSVGFLRSRRSRAGRRLRQLPDLLHFLPQCEPPLLACLPDRTGVGAHHPNLAGVMCPNAKLGTHTTPHHTTPQRQHARPGKPTYLPTRR